jgi:hypothetical protein
MRDVLYPPHYHACHQFLRPGQNRLPPEERARIVEFQQIGFASQPGGIVNRQPVLLERLIEAGIARRAGIDRYLEEGAASAAQGFEGYGQDRAAGLAQVGFQRFGDDGTHG